MKWGISFWVDASLKTEMWAIPPPSKIEARVNWEGKKKLLILYQFEYSPQSSREWNRVAGFKVQLGAMTKDAEFFEFEPQIVDRTYKISELGKHLKKYPKFPKPFIEGTPYQILCRYAKRLYYEKKLHLEQLISVSLWLATLDGDGTKRRPSTEAARQCLKRAYAAYMFALKHLDEWDQKLDPVALREAHARGAANSTAVRREATKEKRAMAKTLRDIDHTYQQIADALDVSLRTVSYWLKG